MDLYINEPIYDYLMLFDIKFKISDENIMFSLTKIENETPIIQDFACSFQEFSCHSIPLQIKVYANHYKIIMAKRTYRVHLKDYENKNMELKFNLPPFFHIEKAKNSFNCKEQSIPFIIEKISNLLTEQLSQLFLYPIFKNFAENERVYDKSKYGLYTEQEFVPLELEFDYVIN